MLMKSIKSCLRGMIVSEEVREYKVLINCSGHIKKLLNLCRNVPVVEDKKKNCETELILFFVCFPSAHLVFL